MIIKKFGSYAQNQKEKGRKERKKRTIYSESWEQSEQKKTEY